MTVEDKQVLHDAALILRTLADEGKVVAFGPARGAAGILAQRLDDIDTGWNRRAADAARGSVIDLETEWWLSIKQAADESKWIPQQYALNDWVSDVCRFLRDGADAARGMTKEDRDACNVGAALANDRAGTFKGHHDAQHWLAVAKRLRALASPSAETRAAGHRKETT